MEVEAGGAKHIAPAEAWALTLSFFLFVCCLFFLPMWLPIPVDGGNAHSLQTANKNHRRRRCTRQSCPLKMTWIVCPKVCLLFLLHTQKYILFFHKKSRLHTFRA